MQSIKLSAERVRRLAMELYFSGHRDYSECLEALELEIERYWILVEMEAKSEKLNN